jgi:hypothetical protein
MKDFANAIGKIMSNMAKKTEKEDHVSPYSHRSINDGNFCKLKSSVASILKDSSETKTMVQDALNEMQTLMELSD